MGMEQQCVVPDNAQSPREREREREGGLSDLCPPSGISTSHEEYSYFFLSHRC